MPRPTAHVLAAHFAERQAGRDRSALGPSDTSRVCDRRTAFALQDTPTTDSPYTLTAAEVGTMLHSAWGSIMAEAHTPGLLIEEPVTVPGLRPGSADMIDPGDFTVTDLKTVGARRFDSWYDGGGPPESVWQQVALYAYGWLLANPDDADWTLIVEALCRETGRVRQYSRPYDEEYAAAALQSLVDAQERLRSTPWDEVGARAGVWCSSCPWRTPCLGPDEKPEPAHVSDPEAVEAAALEYLDLRRQINELEDRREKLLAEFGDADGTYGSVSITWTKQSEQVDWKEARRLLVEEHGIPLPIKGMTRRRIVKRA